MEYRLGIGLPVDSFNAGRAVIRAVQDMKAAIRFFRQSHATGNAYRIHPDYIFAGGSSAGAFTALQLAYMDSTEVPAFLNVANLGGLEGTSGNPGYSSNVTGVISLCGALADSSWIAPGDVPFISMHGDHDQIMPFQSAIIIIFGFPVLRVDGSASLHVRATNTGVNNPFYTFLGADHVPYAGTTAAAIAYMDTTERFVKTFLRPQLGAPIGIPETATPRYAIYPNPATQSVFIEAGTAATGKTIVYLADFSGRVVRKQTFEDRVMTLDLSGLSGGLYTLQLINGDKSVVKKLMVN